jgi:23S rRNA (pseudouridine1915-N3)-methyltransferase
VKLKLYYIGKSNFGFVEEGIKLYESRIRHFVDFGHLLVPDVKNARNMPVAELKKKEGQLLLKNVAPIDYLCLLDENGQDYCSQSFAGMLSKTMDQGVKTIVFMIGGAYGFSDELYQRANHKLSLSKMTFSHQLVRIIFLEQLYRAFTIIKGIPYHNQ